MKIALLLHLAILVELFFEKGLVVEPLLIDKSQLGGRIRAPGILAQTSIFIGTARRACAGVRRQLFATDTTFKRTIEIGHDANSWAIYCARVTLVSSSHSASICAGVRAFLPAREYQ